MMENAPGDMWANMPGSMMCKPLKALFFAFGGISPRKSPVLTLRHPRSWSVSSNNR